MCASAQQVHAGCTLVAWSRLARSWGGSKKGVEKDERSDGIKCTKAKEGIHQAERARDRHAPSATIHMRGRGRKKEREKEMRERNGKGWKDEKNKRNRPRCTVKRARDAPQDGVPHPPRLSFYFANMFAVEFMAGGGESAGRTTCIASSTRGASCKVHSGCLPDCTGHRGARATPFLPPWCMYTYRATCADLIRREVQRPCHVNEKSAVVRAHVKLCGNASDAHVLSVITLTTGICSNDSFKGVRCNVFWGQ